MTDTRLQEMCTYGRAFLLTESLRNRLIAAEATDPAIAAGIQIRLDSS